MSYDKKQLREWQKYIDEVHRYRKSHLKALKEDDEKKISRTRKLFSEAMANLRKIPKDSHSQLKNVPKYAK